MTRVGSQLHSQKKNHTHFPALLCEHAGSFTTPLILYFFILYYLVLLHILAIFLYFWPSRRDAMSTRFPFVPHLSNFLTFPYYSLNTRFSFLVVFLRCSYSRAILRVRFFSPFFIFPLLQMVWRAWILARHLSFLRQPVNRVLYTLVIVSKFYLTL